MAVIKDSGTCRHCGESITLRIYAAPYAVDERARKYGVQVWVTGSGQFPGDQRVCESHIMDNDIGSYDQHEPIAAN